jgi:hypothetical protein
MRIGIALKFNVEMKKCRNQAQRFENKESSEHEKI